MRLKKKFVPQKFYTPPPLPGFLMVRPLDRTNYEHIYLRDTIYFFLIFCLGFLCFKSQPLVFLAESCNLSGKFLNGEAITYLLPYYLTNITVKSTHVSCDNEFEIKSKYHREFYILFPTTNISSLPDDNIWSGQVPIF